MNPPHPPRLTPPALGELLSFGLWMRKEGYRESTIQSTVQALRAVAKRANLLDPESTKSYLASAKVSENRKSKLADDLARFYHHMRIRFEKPRYRRIDKIPFIPSQQEVDQLTAGVGKKMSTFLRLLSETGMGPGEAWNLKWTDIDYERTVVNVTPEKGSNARQLEISNQLVAMMNQLPHSWEFMFRNPSIDPLQSIKTLTGKIEDLAHKITDLNTQTQRILLERKTDKEEFLRLLQTRIGDAEEWRRQADGVSKAWQELLSIEQGFYDKISLFHNVEDRIGEIMRVLQSHEIRLAGCEENARQLGQQPLLSTDTEPDVCEGRTYSNEFGERLRKAWQTVNNPRSQALAGWLTEDQRSLTPREVDLLSTIYLVDNIKGQHAHTPGLEPFLKWKRGEISTVASHLTVRNFIRGTRLEKERWSGSGTSALIYSLTERALRMFISSDPITGAIHHAMELEIIREVFTENPPKLYLTVTQTTGEKRCDGIIQTRKDSKAWDQLMTGVNIETPDEVRAHSQLPPHEGQVIQNMVEPFGFGAKHVLIVCLEESVPKLEELRRTLPTWLASRIEINVVKV